MLPLGLTAASVCVVKLHFLVPAAVEKNVLHFFRQRVVRLFEIEFVVRGQRLDHLEVERAAVVPAMDRAA